MIGGELVGAAASIKELKELIQILDEDLPAEIIDIIEDELILRESKMLHFTNGLLKEFHDFTNLEDLQLEATLFKSKSFDFKDNTIDWDDVLTILDLSGNLEPFLSDLVNTVAYKVIPIFEFDCTAAIATVKGRTHFKITKNSPESAKVVDLSKNIVLLAEFISTFIFPGDIGPTDTFIDIWSEQLSKLVRRLSSKTKAPLSEVEVESIKKLEVGLMTLDLLSPEYFPLTNPEIHQHQKMLTQRIDLLLQTKKVLLSGDPNLVQVSEGTCRGGFFSTGKKLNVDFKDFKAGKEGVDRNFCLSEFSISNQTQILSDIMFSLLDSLSPNGQENQSVLSTIRDMFYIYRAIDSICF